MNVEKECKGEQNKCNTMRKKEFLVSSKNDELEELCIGGNLVGKHKSQRWKGEMTSAL